MYKIIIILSINLIIITILEEIIKLKKDNLINLSLRQIYKTVKNHL